MTALQMETGHFPGHHQMMPLPGLHAIGSPSGLPGSPPSHKDGFSPLEVFTLNNH